MRELVRKNKRPVALFVYEAHDLNGHTLTGLKRLMGQLDAKSADIKALFNNTLDPVRAIE